MNWKQSAAKREEQREAYREELRKKNDLPMLLRFNMPRLFEAITHQINEELIKCPCQIETNFDAHMWRGTIRKRGYPSTDLSFQVRSLSPERADTEIVCATNGLSITNEPETVTRRYRVTASFDHTSFARLDDTGGVHSELTLPMLVDDILEPFAERIA